MESENKLTFLVHLKATKAQVKQAVETLYNAKVLAVNTMIGVDGKKTAYVRLDASTPAIDVATSLGLL
jgi:ribosomal protein L23